MARTVTYDEMCHTGIDFWLFPWHRQDRVWRKMTKPDREDEWMSSTSRDQTFPATGAVALLSCERQHEQETSRQPCTTVDIQVNGGHLHCTVFFLLLCLLYSFCVFRSSPRPFFLSHLYISFSLCLNPKTEYST